MNIQGTVILTPIYNDWDSFQQLLNDIDKTLLDVVENIVVFAINDGSTSPITFNVNNEYRSIQKVEILHLSRNVGHQRAIAIGLAYLENNIRPSRVIIMDADGEDAPADIPALIAEEERTKKIVFARRGQRREGLWFKFYYSVYRFLFFMLTGQKINFGNFCIIPGTVLRQIVLLPEIWGHFASGVLRSGLPHHAIMIDRRKRYQGKSKMNFVSLVMHGLSAFSVYTDIMSVRLILFTLLVILVVFVSGIGLMYVKYFTNLAIPGWATTVGLGLVMILLQAFILLLSLVFNMLNSKSSQSYTPARYFEDYLLKVETIYG